MTKVYQILIIISVISLETNQRPFSLSSNSTCKDEACLYCPNSIAKCKECKEFYFQTEGKCQSCIKGCRKCKGKLICSECSSTRQLSSSKKCRLKTWIFIALIGSGVLLFVVCGVMMLVFDKRAERKEKEFKKKLLLYKKKLLEKKKKEMIEKSMKGAGNRSSYHASTGIGTPEGKGRASYDFRDSSGGERKSRVILSGGKLTQYLHKIRLKRQASMNNLGENDLMSSCMLKKSNSSGNMFVGDSYSIAEEDEYMEC